MKYILIISLSTSLFFVGCQSTDDDKEDDNGKIYQELTATKYDAVEINNQVSSIQKGVVTMIDQVFKSDTTIIDQKISDAIFDLNISKSRLESIGEQHELADYFATSVIQLIQFYKSEFEGEFISVVKILKKKEVTPADKTFLFDYDQGFADTEAVLFEDILVRQDSFANYFSIGLTDKM